MTITYTRGNLFESQAQSIVVTTNIVGAMGKGVALECKKRYPAVYRYYRQLFVDGLLDIHRLDAVEVSDTQQMILFPTKKHWRQPSRLEWIEANLCTLTQRYNAMGIDTLAIPPLGCGNGGLNFIADVQPLIERYLKNHPLEVLVYV